MSRVLPLLGRHLDPAVAQVLDQLLHRPRVAHHVVLAVEEERRGGDGGAAEGADAGVELVNGVAPGDAEVQQAGLSYERLPLGEYSFS